MRRVRNFPERIQDQPERKPVRRFALTPVGGLLLAAIPVALLALYVTRIAPRLIPVPADVRVPYPAATRFLEGVCLWCGAHPARVVLLSMGLLLVGLFPAAGKRYLAGLALVASLALLFTYLSISAPIDRLLHSVEAQISRETRSVPDYLPGGTRRD